MACNNNPHIDQLRLAHWTMAHRRVTDVVRSIWTQLSQFVDMHAIPGPHGFETCTAFISIYADGAVTPESVLLKHTKSKLPPDPSVVSEHCKLLLPGKSAPPPSFAPRQSTSLSSIPLQFVASRRNGKGCPSAGGASRSAACPCKLGEDVCVANTGIMIETSPTP